MAKRGRGIHLGLAASRSVSQQQPERVNEGDVGAASFVSSTLLAYMTSRMIAK